MSMNYQQFYGSTPYAINLTSFSSGSLLYLDFGSYTYLGSVSTKTYDYICQFAVDSGISSTGLGLLYIDSTHCYLIGQTFTDFVSIKNSTYNDENDIIAYEVINHKSDNITTLSTPTEYLSFDTLGYYNHDFYYDDFDVSIDRGETCYFDYSNQYFPIDSSYLNWYVSHYYDSDSISYDFYYSVIEMDKQGTIIVGGGRPYQSASLTAYQNGYASGVYTGYQNGFADGQATQMNTETATAFTYISGAFHAVDNILSIEVLPHITLGICFAIPVILIMIMTIFKIVKK